MTIVSHRLPMPTLPRPLPIPSAPAFATAIALLFLALPIGRGAEARELHWRELAVEARLDADGRLHVRERQVMVFTGDWNGGERTFRLEPGQRIELHAMSRVVDGGRAVPLTRGALNLVDHYAWHDARTLRWRSRGADDPPFDQTEITYVLDYTLSDILVPEDGGEFRFAHDFAFTDRPGDIARFTLDLTLDPVWMARAPSFDPHVEAGPLRPGQGYVVRIPLSQAGGGGGWRPAGVWYGAPRAVRVGVALALLLALGLEIAHFLRRERAAGRFLPLTPAAEIDRRWLDERVFHLKPEVVGAAYDHATSGPEVAAVIARLVTEGKLESRIESKGAILGKRDVLHLELLVDEADLPGYDAKLVKALFFGGRTTDTDRIKAHYKRTGFDPVRPIRDPLRTAVKKALGPDLRSAELALRPTLVLLAFGLAGIVLAVLRRRAEIQIAVPMIVLGVASAICLGLLAHHGRRRRARSGGSLVLLILGLASLAGWIGFMIALAPIKPSALIVVFSAIFGLGLCRFILTFARTRERPAALALRRDLESAREFFALELQKREPHLADAWVPYLVALGLGGDMDRWFRAFGGAAAGAAGSRGLGSNGGSWSGSSGGHGWSGGGGAFGGAGASGSWAAAMGSMAAGVPSPSSGSGGGGGGGGSSSGGGGGGGW